MAAGTSLGVCWSCRRCYLHCVISTARPGFVPSQCSSSSRCPAAAQSARKGRARAQSCALASSWHHRDNFSLGTRTRVCRLPLTLPSTMGAVSRVTMVSPCSAGLWLSTFTQAVSFPLCTPALLQDGSRQVRSSQAHSHLLSEEGRRHAGLQAGCLQGSAKAPSKALGSAAPGEPGSACRQHSQPGRAKRPGRQRGELAAAARISPIQGACLICH